MTKTTNSKLKDFDLEELLGSTKSHTERIESLEGRVADLEQNISNNFWFAEKFVNSQKEQKQIDEAIKGIIKEYDNHNLKVNGAALAKWVGALLVGGLLGALITGYFSQSQNVISSPNSYLFFSARYFAQRASIAFLAEAFLCSGVLPELDFFLLM